MSFDDGALVTVATNPAFEDADDAPTNPTHVYLAFGIVTFDATGDRTGPLLTTPMYTWFAGSDPSGHILNVVSAEYPEGAFTGAIDTTGLGGNVVEWRMWGDGAVQATFTGSFPVNTVNNDWPYPVGYCNFDDVQARINGGSWNVNGTDVVAYPTPEQTNDFIRMASAHIDMRLATMGFNIPIAPASSSPIKPQAFLILRDIAAEYACAYVERTRHGSTDENEDADAKYHMQLADDYLALIANGDINFSMFNVAGTFNPVANVALGIIVTGNRDDCGNPRGMVTLGGYRHSSGAMQELI